MNKKGHVRNSSFLMVVFISGYLVFLVWMRTNVNYLAKEIGTLTKKQEVIALEKERLERRVSQLDNYLRIKNLAGKKFSLNLAKEKPTLIQIKQQDYLDDKKRIETKYLKKEFSGNLERLKKEKGKK